MTTMEKQISQLNSLVIEKIFGYLEENEKDQQTFRSLNSVWFMESSRLWRKWATVMIQSSLTPSGDQLRNTFLDEFTNIREDNDPNNLISLPFRRYKIINSRFNFLPTCAGNLCSSENHLHSDHLRPSPEFNNFWRLCASNITHLQITNYTIHNKNCLINLLSSLLFNDCPSLKKLSLNVEKISWSEGTAYSLPSPSSRSRVSLESFGFQTPSDSHNSQRLIDLHILKEIVAFFPKIKELELEENAVQMMKALRSPVTPSGDYIKLEKVVIKIRDPKNYWLPHVSFFNLREYVKVVNPPLTKLEVSVCLKDVRCTSIGFHSFFTFWGSNLTHLVLNIDPAMTYGCKDNHFTDLSGRNFPELTHFHLNFKNDSRNISFDFGAVKKMPKLKVFRCESDAFKNVRSYGINYGYLIENRHCNDKDMEYAGTTHDWNRNISSGQNWEALGQNQIILQNLTEFSFRLNYKFGEESLQKLKSWAGNIEILEIVVDHEEMFLDFLEKEFQWWPHSLDKLVLHCEADLDTEKFKNSIRGKESRPVETQFCQLEKAPYPQTMYHLV